MPRQDFDAELDEQDDVDELDDAELIARLEAENDALIAAHADENSLPWHLCNIFFRPRLAALRWTEGGDDQLRDRAVAIAAFTTATGVLALVASSRFPKLWGARIEFVLLTFLSFLLLCAILAGSAKAFDAIGRGLGASENYDRIRVVLALLLVPPIVVLVPIQILRLCFGDESEGTHDRSVIPAGIGWLLLAAYGVWLVYFPIGAWRVVQLLPTAKAVAQHVAGTLLSLVFLSLVAVVLYFALKLAAPNFYLEPFDLI